MKIWTWNQQREYFESISDILEMEPMEAEISGEEEEMEVEAIKEVKKMVLDKNSSRKRNKQGSVPVRKKKQQMDID